jgi:hypothetical protein
MERKRNETMRRISLNFAACDQQCWNRRRRPLPPFLEISLQGHLNHILRLSVGNKAGEGINIDN